MNVCVCDRPPTWCLTARLPDALCLTARPPDAVQRSIRAWVVSGGASYPVATGGDPDEDSVPATGGAEAGPLLLPVAKKGTFS